MSMHNKALKIAGWVIGGIVLLIIFGTDLETEPINSILNVVVIGSMLLAVLFAVHSTIRDITNKKLKASIEHRIVTELPKWIENNHKPSDLEVLAFAGRVSDLIEVNE